MCDGLGRCCKLVRCAAVDTRMHTPLRTPRYACTHPRTDTLACTHRNTYTYTCPDLCEEEFGVGAHHVGVAGGGPLRLLHVCLCCTYVLYVHVSVLERTRIRRGREARFSTVNGSGEGIQPPTHPLNGGLGGLGVVALHLALHEPAERHRVPFVQLEAPVCVRECARGR